jgi:hypothetical protein
MFNFSQLPAAPAANNAPNPFSLLGSAAAPVADVDETTKLSALGDDFLDKAATVQLLLTRLEDSRVNLKKVMESSSERERLERGRSEGVRLARDAFLPVEDALREQNEGAGALCEDVNDAKDGSDEVKRRAGRLSGGNGGIGGGGGFSDVDGGYGAEDFPAPPLATFARVAGEWRGELLRRLGALEARLDRAGAATGDGGASTETEVFALLEALLGDFARLSERAGAPVREAHARMLRAVKERAGACSHPADGGGGGGGAFGVPLNGAFGGGFLPGAARAGAGAGGYGASRWDPFSAKRALIERDAREARALRREQFIAALAPRAPRVGDGGATDAATAAAAPPAGAAPAVPGGTATAGNAAAPAAPTAAPALGAGGIFFAPAPAAPVAAGAQPAAFAPSGTATAAAPAIAVAAAPVTAPPPPNAPFTVPAAAPAPAFSGFTAPAAAAPATYAFGAFAAPAAAVPASSSLFAAAAQNTYGGQQTPAATRGGGAPAAGRGAGRRRP